MLSALDNMTADSRVASIMSHLSPAVVRVGGISADWVRYVLDNVTYPPPSGAGTPTWFSEPFNMSLGTLHRLDALLHASGFSFALDLSELYGRTCNYTNATDPASHGQWCEGAWNMSNVRDLLQRLHDDGTVGSAASALFAFELGNELTGHISTATNLADIAAAAALLREIWADAPAPPPLFAPGIADCAEEGALQILAMLPDIPGVAGFSFHSYPGGAGKNLSALLLNPEWLRNDVLGQTPLCLSAWNAPDGARARGLRLWATEAASSYNWAAGPPAQNSVLDNYFTVAQYGAFASTGVEAVARWSFNEPNAFATIIQNGSRWDAAADFWILVAMRHLLGPRVLAVAGDAGATATIVAFAQCTLTGATRRRDATTSGEDEYQWRWDLSRVAHPLRGKNPLSAGVIAPQLAPGNGSIVLMIANPNAYAVNLSIAEWVSAARPFGAAPVRTVPRLDWVFTAPGGPDDLGATSPVLNAFDGGGTLLRLADDGSLPPMRGFYVSANGATAVALPPRSQLLTVLLEAAAPACIG